MHALIFGFRWTRYKFPSARQSSSSSSAYKAQLLPLEVPIFSTFFVIPLNFQAFFKRVFLNSLSSDKKDASQLSPTVELRFLDGPNDQVLSLLAFWQAAPPGLCISVWKFSITVVNCVKPVHDSDWFRHLIVCSAFLQHIQGRMCSPAAVVLGMIPPLTQRAKLLVQRDDDKSNSLRSTKNRCGLLCHPSCRTLAETCPNFLEDHH